jgi:branched-chain amino acid transport system substrate-binding protein
MRRRTWTRALACTGALALLAAGCGGDDDDDSDSTTGPTATTAATAAPTTAGSTDASATTAAASDPTTAAPGTTGAEATTATTAAGSDGDYVVPTETGPADESLEPVKIGFVNQSEGTPSFPGPLAAAQGAVDYINESLGGIDGHPIELVECNTGLDPDSNQQCAQQMVNDDGINIVTTQFVLGSDAFWPVLEQGGLTALEGTPLNPTDYASPAAVAYTPGGAGIVVGLADYAAKHLGATSLTVVAEGNAGGQAVIDGMKVSPPLAGLTIDSIIAGTAETDLAGALQAKDNDAYILVAAAQTCIQVAKALAQIGSDTPVLGVSSCGDPSVISEVGDDVDGWLVGAPSALPGLEPADPELTLFGEVMEAGGRGEAAGQTAASQSFGQLITLWQIGNEIGYDNLSRQSWHDALMAFTGPMFLGPRNLSCPGAALPALCTTEARIMEVHADGSFSDPVPGPYDAYAAG